MKKLNLFFLILFTITHMSQNLIAQDWAELNRFNTENKKLGAPSIGENRTVFIGNSITEEWSQFSPEFFEGKSYVNRGLSGQTTPQMLLRFRQDVIDLNPKVVVILAGTNDIAGNTGPITLKQIMDNIISMEELAKANNIKVILSSVLPAFVYPWKVGQNPNIKIPALNEMIKKYSKENNIIYLDYFSAMTDGNNGLKAKLTYDGVHPNKAGYEVMSPLADNAILDVLKEE